MNYTPEWDNFRFEFELNFNQEDVTESQDILKLCKWEIVESYWHIILHGDTPPLVCPGSLFASAAPHLVSWDEIPHLQAPGVERGAAASVISQRKVLLFNPDKFYMTLQVLLNYY